MGRIKSLSIKKKAKELLQERAELFSKSFEENKKAVAQFSAEKKTRNKIAGYITKLIKYKEANTK